MRVFITGASGFVGSAVVAELLRAGHRVLGLARSDGAAQSISSAGADVQRGSLDDLDSLRDAAAASDAVIHTAFIHDFANFAASAEADKRAIETLGAALEGSGRPLIVTAGTSVHITRGGGVATESDMPDPGFPRVSEQTAQPFCERGVRVSVMRLPPSVHGAGDHAFIPRLIGIAREKGVSAYVGDGRNRWASVHRLDAAVLYRLAIESEAAGTILHAVGDEGVPMREIATVIGRRLNVPVTSVEPHEAAEHFGFLGLFAGADLAASGAITSERFGWKPVHPGLLADLDSNAYFPVSDAHREVPA
ncbi:MAG: SDR family oxidoreductase [Candidatus Eremiobacteraeota bacterium]|nr:SDR family oxidoreductase [Candidatus Eremiobacteraeota bacterium]